MLPSAENVATDLCPSDIFPKISQWSSFNCNPGTFQTDASVLGLGVRLCACPLGVVLVCSCSPASLDISPVVFQNQMSQVIMFLVQASWTMGPDVGLGHPCSSGRASMVVISLLFVCCHARGVLTKPRLCLSYLSPCGFFFISFVVYDLFF